MNKTHTPLPAQVELSIGSEGTEYKNEDGEPIETQAVLFDGDSGTIAYVLTDLAAWREIAQALHDRYNSHDRLVAFVRECASIKCTCTSGGLCSKENVEAGDACPDCEVAIPARALLVELETK